MDQLIGGTPGAGQPEPPVGVRLALAGRCPPDVGAVFEPHLDARGGPPGRRVEYVCGQRHGLSSFVMRRRVIFLSSSRTTVRSASSSCPSRARSCSSISWPDRPLAQIRKIWPKRCS